MERLSYEQKHRHGVSRRWMRMAVPPLAVLAGTWFYFAQLAPRMRVWKRQRTEHAALAVGMAIHIPFGQVQYVEDPVAAATLLKDSAHYSTGWYGSQRYAVRSRPSELQTIEAAIRGLSFRGEPVLFAGEVSNPALNERMALVVSLEYTRPGFWESNNRWTFYATELLPAWTGDVGQREWKLTLPVSSELYDPSARVEFRAGRVNAADPRRFEIPYSVNGVPGVIDGSLDDLSRVILTVHSGPATRAVIDARP